MKGKLAFIVLIFSVFLEIEYFMEHVIYNELPEIGPLKLIIAFLLFCSQTFIQLLLIFYINIQIIRFIEARLSWKENFWKRLFLEFLSTTFVAAVITIPVVAYIDFGLIAKFFQFPSETLPITIYYNVLYITVINSLFVVTYEVVFLYGERNRLQLQWERAQRQSILSQFEALKNQVNPHFLLNSMHTLSKMVNEHPKRASQFIDEFINVYRKMLTMNIEVLIPIRDEMDFARSYSKLYESQYGEFLTVDFKIEDTALNKMIPPFSIQLLIENAIKHNAISADSPLRILVHVSREKIQVQNNRNPKKAEHSTGIGLKNLSERYQLLSNRQPEVKENEEVYEVNLPVLSG